MDAQQLVNLVDRAIAKERFASHQLFEHYRPQVWNLAMRYCRGDKANAEDVLQESFMQAFQKLHTIKNKEKFASWLYRIVSNTALQKIRKSKREGAFLAKYTHEQQLPGNNEDPLLREKKIHIVNQLLANLPDDKVKQIVQLHYGEPSHTAAEISHQLHIPRGTVTVMLKRFREKIKKKLLLELIKVDKEMEVSV